MQKIPFNIIVIARQYLLAVSVFTIFRLMLLIAEWHRIDGSVSIIDIFHALLCGLRFDVAVSGYILILPFVILSVCTLAEKDIKLLRIFTFIWVSIFFIAAFLICAGDIPYFTQFFTHITYDSFNVVDANNINFLLNMIINEPKYWIYLFVFLILSVFFSILTQKNILKTEFHPKSYSTS